MKRFAARLVLAAAVLAAVRVDAAQQWVCLDADGNEVLQNEPCAEINASFRRQDVPAYVWGILAVLGLTWTFVLSPPPLLSWWRRDRHHDSGPEWTDPQPAAAAAGAAVAVPSPPPAAPEAVSQRIARPETPSQRVPRPETLSQRVAKPRPEAWSLETLARVSPARFDELVQALWHVNGYKAVLTGDDVKIHTPSGQLFAVARRGPSSAEPVSASALAGLWDHVQQNGAGIGISYGVAGFATDAVMFAQGKGLRLVSGAELLAQLLALKPEQQQALLDHVSR